MEIALQAIEKMQKEPFRAFHLFWHLAPAFGSSPLQSSWSPYVLNLPTVAPLSQSVPEMQSPVETLSPWETHFFTGREITLRHLGA